MTPQSCTMPRLTCPDTWPYQSNGNCTNHCTQEGGSWAFAVLEYTNCWCSNYVPGDTTDISNCMVDCPGFPDEKCGSKDKGLYLYVQMDGQPSGTKGGSQPSSTAAASSKQQQQQSTSTVSTFFSSYFFSTVPFLAVSQFAPRFPLGCTCAITCYRYLTFW